MIDNTLRTARNRMVHDFWFTVPTDTGKPEVQRVHLKPKVVNEQAFKKRLQLADMKVISAAEIAKLCDSILDANAKILELQHQFEWSPLHGISQQLIPPRSPLQGRAKKAPPPPPKP